MIKEELRKEIERLKAENARLAAQIELMNVALGNATRRELWVETTGGQLPESTNALRDLLAPTIAYLLSGHPDGDKHHPNCCGCKELSRLRSITKP